LLTRFALANVGNQLKGRPKLNAMGADNVLM